MEFHMDPSLGLHVIISLKILDHLGQIAPERRQSSYFGPLARLMAHAEADGWIRSGGVSDVTWLETPFQEASLVAR
jgi:hypothetical protein